MWGRATPARDVRGGQWAVLLVCVVLGMLLAVQIRTQREVSRTLPYQRLEQLTGVLQQVEAERSLLREEVTELRDKLLRAGEGRDLIAALESELEKARMAAGTLPVKGPGVRVIVDDSKRPRQPGEDPALFIIHDDDLLKVVNELRAAGAEALAINGQRLVATSEIRCAGPTISINNTRTAPPVEILAIGDPQAMESSLRMRGGVVETLGAWGIEVRVRRESELMVPAYQGSLRFRFAQPARKDGGGQ